MTDPFVAELEEVVREKKATNCEVCKVLARESKDRVRALSHALSSKVGSERIAHILKKQGYEASRWQVQRHRNEEHTG